MDIDSAVMPPDFLTGNRAPASSQADAEAAAQTTLPPGGGSDIDEDI